MSVLSDGDPVMPGNLYDNHISQLPAAVTLAPEGKPMTDLPADDAGRFEIIREHLYTAVVGDILDELGRLHQFLPQSLQAIGPGMALVGRAMPVLIADVFERPDPPFGRLTEIRDH